MKKIVLVVGCIFLVCPLYAGTYQIVYQQQVDDAEDYVHIDPITGVSGELEGFIYSDTGQNRFIIDRFGSDSVLVVEAAGSPVMTINYTKDDSLVIFTLSAIPLRLGSVKISHDHLTDSYIEPNLYYGYGNPKVRRQNIEFDLTGDSIAGVIIENCYRYSMYDMTMGPSEENVSTSIVYDLDLTEETIRLRATLLRLGHLLGNTHREQAVYEAQYYWWNYQDSYDDPNYGCFDYGNIVVTDPNNDFVAERRSESGRAYAMFIDDFISDDQYDELIFYGRAADLLGLHADTIKHVACYNFSGESPKEVWYRPLWGVSLDHIYKPEHYIAGMIPVVCSRPQDAPRNLYSPTFFETGKSLPVLNLVGRSHDTIFVFQFHTPTDVADTTPDNSLPASFVLYQNYPNPFNGETRIRFSNSHKQHFSLEIYNILGRKVTTLFDQEATVGDHDVIWNGQSKNGKQQATGVYFVKLKSATGSRTTKLIYLK